MAIIGKPLRVIRGNQFVGFVLQKRCSKHGEHRNRSSPELCIQQSPCIRNWQVWELRRGPLLGVARGLLQERPLQFSTEMFVSKVGNPRPTLGQLLASRILYVLLVGEKQHEIARARFCTQSCSKVGQLLVNSSPTPHPMGSCRGLPCSSPLATPDLLCSRERKISPKFF